MTDTERLDWLIENILPFTSRDELDEAIRDDESADTPSGCEMLSPDDVERRRDWERTRGTR